MRKCELYAIGEWKESKVFPYGMRWMNMDSGVGIAGYDTIGKHIVRATLNSFVFVIGDS